MTWRARELWAEAWADVGPRVRSVGWIAGVTLTGLGIATVSVGLAATRQEENLRRDGSLVVAVSYRASADLAHDRTIPGRACEALNGAEGVEAAGGRLLDAAPQPTLLLGGPVVPAVSVTPNALRVWEPAAPLDGPVVGTDLDRLGAATVGSSLLWPDGARTAVVGRSGADLPPSVLRGSVVVPHAAGAPLAECWIRMTPGSLDAGLDLAAAVFAQSEVDVVPWLAAQTQTLSPAQQWHAVADRYPWLAGAVLLAVVVLLVTWTRRAETGVYRAFGTSTTELTVLVSLEVALVLLPAAVWATAAALAGTAVLADGTISRDTAGVVVRVVASTTLATLALTPVAARLALRGTILDQLKDR